MLKNELIKKIDESKQNIKSHLREKGLKLDDVSALIKKILEGEPKEIQIATNLYYIDGFNTEEISIIMGENEINVLNYFQLILFKIKLVLNIENKDTENKYAVKNYLSKNKIPNTDNGSLLDKKI